MQRFAFLALILAALTMPPVLAIAGAGDPAAAPVLVVIPPWRERDAAVTAAGGHVVGLRDAPFGVLVTGANLPDLARRLRDGGAWAVLDGRSIARLCGGTT